MENRSRSSTIYILWRDIQDIIGNASLWPIRIRRLFWTQHLRYFQRFLIVIFSYVNGLNPQLLIEWLKIQRGFSNAESERHVRELFIRLEEGKYNNHTRYNYYGYNVYNKRYEYVNGTEKKTHQNE